MVFRLFDALGRVWHRLTEPKLVVAEPERRRLRLLAEVLLALFILDFCTFVVILPINLLAYRRAPPVYDISVIAAAALFFFVAHRLTFQGRYRAAASLTIGATSLIVWGSIFFFRQMPQIAAVILGYSTLPVLISRLLFSTRAALGVMVVNGLGYLLVRLLSPDMSPLVWLIAVSVPTLLSALSIMAGTTYERHLLHIEAQRRALSEAEVEMRRLLGAEAEQRAMAEALQVVGVALSQSLELDTVLDRIVEQIGQVIQYDAANVMLLDHSGKYVHVARMYGYDQFGQPVAQDMRAKSFGVAETPNLRQMADTHQPLIIPDTADYPGWVAVGATTFVHSWAGAPIVARGQVIAFFSMDKIETGYYRPEHAGRLALFANQAAIAIENARLYSTLRNYAREHDALLTATEALLSTLELEPLLHNILSAAIAAIPAADKGTILLADLATGQLQIRATVGYADPRVGMLAFAGKDGYSAKAQREKRPLLISDARADPAIRYEGDIPEVSAILSAVVAPLLIQDQEPLGVIALDSIRLGAFADSDLRLLVAFANTATLAIDHARLHARVQGLAVRDGLTGLANRRAFDLALSRELERATQAGQPLALLMLDIDSFKPYNDVHGHPAGDDRLRALANLLREQVLPPDFAARYGGEEFAVILPYTGKLGALELAERIRGAAEAACPADLRVATNAQGEVRVETVAQPISGYTVSIGVSAFPDDAETPEALLRAADNAELSAKQRGKNRVCPAGVPKAA